MHHIAWKGERERGHARAVRCLLELRSPNRRTGSGETWAFSGADGRALRQCLDQLDDFMTDPPVERHTLKEGHVVEAEDRWRAAMLLWPDEPSRRGRISSARVRADAAWTPGGALRLAEILPERLEDLRAAITTRFVPESAVGAQGPGAPALDARQQFEPEASPKRVCWNPGTRLPGDRYWFSVTLGQSRRTGRACPRTTPWLQGSATNADEFRVCGFAAYRFL
jgi:hypothetical protein